MNPEERISEFITYRNKKFRPHQKEAIEYITNSTKRFVFLEAPTGCHEPHQGILLSNGTIREAKDIFVGDELINENGEFCTVLSLIDGYGEMFRITPTKGNPWVVNGDHILTLKRTNLSSHITKKRKDCIDGEIIDVKISEWMLWTKSRKHLYKLLRSPVKNFHTHQDHLPINPYMLGLLLGDGTMINNVVGICTADEEVLSYVEKYAETNRLKIRQSKSNRYGYYFRKVKNGNKKTWLLEELIKLGLHGHRGATKFIPHIYKTSSWKNRIDILSGLLDTDGSMSGNGFDFISKSKRLAEDVVFLARSIGLAAYIQLCRKGCQGGFTGSYYRVSISGNCEIISCKIKRKKTAQRLQKKNVLVTGFSVKKINKGKFYGWEVSGNGRYLLDDFTVTHNSGKSLIAMVSGVMKSGTTYSVHSKILQSQITSDFKEAKSLFGRSNYPCRAHQGLTCDECFHTTSAPCSNKKFGCIYEEEKRSVLASRLRILNYDYLLSEANYVGKFSKGKFNIVDEADNLENTLINFISLTFTNYALSRLGLSDHAKMLKMSSTNKAELLNSWICFGVAAKEQAIKIIMGLTKEIEEFEDPITPEEAKVIKEKSRVVRLLEKIDIFLTNVDSSWLLDNSQEDKYIFRPLWLNINLSEQFMWRHAAQWVLMSASFLPLHLECKRLGIPLDEADYMLVPSNFPVENRRVVVNPVADLTSKTMEVEVPKLVIEVKNILALHPNERGLIHGVSYKLSQRVYEEIADPRLLIHNSTNRQEVLDKFLSSITNAVLISPSMDRGVSLDYDRARFQIICKMPWLSLGDKITSARVYGSRMGQEWFQATAMLTVLQMCGRACRSEDDKSITYILDNQFKRILLHKANLLPRWFRDAIEFA